MTDTQPPEQSQEPAIPGDTLRETLYTASFGRGASWIGEGWEYFKANPGIWIGMVVLSFVLTMIASVLPIIGFFAGILMLYFMAGMMKFCDNIHHQNNPQFGDLFVGFSERAVPLLLTGILYLVGTMVIAIIVVIVMVIFGGAGAIFGSGGSDEALAAAMGIGLLLAVLFGMLFALPLIMAIWFAPALIMLHNLDAVEAMKQSFMGCLQNILPFLLFGIVFFVLFILGSIPLLLGLLIVMPMMYAATYAAYREIYLEP